MAGSARQSRQWATKGKRFVRAKPHALSAVSFHWNVCFGCGSAQKSEVIIPIKVEEQKLDKCVCHVERWKELKNIGNFSKLAVFHLKKAC